MKQKRKRRLNVLLPWVLIIAVLGGFTIIGYINRNVPIPLGTEFEKVNLLSTMRIKLLEAIEAEKNAVLAITDEASVDFAARARQVAEDVESNRKEIESIIYREKIPRETELMNEFSSCWLQFRKLNETILDLATQNTNLKAQKISVTQCTQELEHFEDSLNRLIQSNKNGDQCNEVVKPAYEAIISGLKILALHKPHIEALDDQEMDKIEKEIQCYDESTRKAFKSLGIVPDLSSNQDLKNAETAYERFISLTGEVLRLSRMNTNLKSAELSLGKKRLISIQCQEILTTLQETVQAQWFKATR